VRDEIGGRGVVHGYGMTEVPMISNGSPTDTDEQLANTDGKPVEGRTCASSRSTAGRPQPDEEGEVRVKGPMVFHGYTDPPSRRGLRRRRVLPHRRPGPLRADGHLTLTGRLKDVIVRKGENISAKEIEDLLYTHPEVVEVAVIGLPDPTRGERVCAVVQLTEGVEASELADVVDFCRQAGLMTQKIPEQLEIRTEWPRAGTGQDRQEEPARRVLGVSRPAGPPDAMRPPPCPVGPAVPDRVRVHREHLPLAHGRVITRRWPPPPCSDGTTLGRHLESPAPAPAPGTRASPCTPTPVAPWNGAASPPSPRGAPVPDGPARASSTWWWRSTDATSRPCAAWGPTRPPLSPAGLRPAGRCGRRRPRSRTTATTPCSTTAAT
jgi:hypothetical protein